MNNVDQVLLLKLTVILADDLLNQHYTSAGGQLWVRLAFGTHSRLCPIDPKFRVVVVVEKEDAYTRLAPPLLNRFEKQVLERTDVMSAPHRRLAARLKVFAETFGAPTAAARLRQDAGAGEDEDDDEAFGQFAAISDLQRAMCGFHADVLSSLALTVAAEAEAGAGWYRAAAPQDDDDRPDAAPSGTLDLERLFTEGVKRLLWTATPEAACRCVRRSGDFTCRLQPFH